MGVKEGALEIYTRIIREYPDSGFVPDAWVSFGEYYFGEQQLELALKAYKKAAAYPKPEVQGFAEYKLGWVYYNLGDFAESCLHFQRVMKLAADVQAQGHKKFTLDREARKDWVTAIPILATPTPPLNAFDGSLRNTFDPWRLIWPIVGSMQDETRKPVGFGGSHCER